jgi:transposase
MISLVPNTKIWLSAGVTDMRKGFAGLSAMTQDVLKRDPYSGHLFVFRGRQGDLIKMIWWDGNGACLMSKRLEYGRFIWPSTTSGAIALREVQLSMLLEGIDWRVLKETSRPMMAG